MKLDYDTPPGQLYRIRSYGPGSVTVNKQVLNSSLIITPTLLVPDWPPCAPEELREEHLRELLKLEPDLVLLGTGARQYFPDPALLLPCSLAGVGIEVMDSGAACRSFNILAAEGRKVAAGIIIGKPVRPPDLSGPHPAATPPPDRSRG